MLLFKDINTSLVNAIQRHTNKPVTAFALLALHEDDSTLLQTSNGVEQWKESIFTIDAQQKIRHAQAASMATHSTKRT
jgi:hypothetical protein